MRVESQHGDRPKYPNPAKLEKSRPYPTGITHMTYFVLAIGQWYETNANTKAELDAKISAVAQATGADSATLEGLREGTVPAPVNPVTI